MRWLLQYWRESSIITYSKEDSVWGNEKPKKKSVSSEEDKLHTWSTSTSGLLESLIPSWIMPTYLLLLFEMMIFRNSFQSGTEFYYQWRKSFWWHLARIVQVKNTRVWETQDRIWIVQYGDSPEESRIWLSQIEDNGEKKYRAGSMNQEFWSQKRKIMRQTS